MLCRGGGSGSPCWTPGLWPAWRRPPLAGCGKHKALQGGWQPSLCSQLILIAKLLERAARSRGGAPHPPAAQVLVGLTHCPRAGHPPTQPDSVVHSVGPVAPVATDTGPNSQTSLDNGSPPSSAPSSPHPPPGLTPPPPPPAFEKLPTMSAAWGTQPTLRTGGYVPPGGLSKSLTPSCTCSRTSLTGP